ncbi:hypothetical protein FGO68_gene14145 [Halteria grandinella]|uniref:Uncharacterized protein n=1 Tax=Halteria grandinella TaxID=5974 RepID=A0A8J8STT7_HALGN|nr:hypothetical protein FGO68_gene14145 [Halteria grandinella]
MNARPAQWTDLSIRGQCHCKAQRNQCKFQRKGQGIKRQQRNCKNQSRPAPRYIHMNNSNFTLPSQFSQG